VTRPQNERKRLHRRSVGGIAAPSAHMSASSPCRCTFRQPSSGRGPGWCSQYPTRISSRNLRRTKPRFAEKHGARPAGGGARFSNV